MNIAGMTPDEALKWLAVALGVLALITGVVVWLGKRRGSRTIALDASLTLAVWWIGISALTLIAGLTQILTYSELSLTDTAVWAPWPGPADTCDLSGAAKEGPVIACASLRTADLTITGVDMGTRWLLAGGQILGSLLVALPGVMLAIIAWHALRGRPFADAVPRTLYIGAGAALLAGIGSAVLNGLGTGAALSGVLPVDGVKMPPVTFAIDPLVLGGALALAALGTVFQHGARLQRDTEGLV